MATNLSHEDRLDRLAEIAIRTGLGLKSGQEVVLTAPILAMPLVRRITEHAYKAGASLVTTLLSDDESTLARFKYAPDAAFDYAPAWMFEGMAQAYRNGAARLAIGGENPALLAGQDPDKVARANKARSIAYRPALELITNFDTNWSIVSYATPAWAALMFPELPLEAAIAKLWDAIFAASRVDTPDPVAAWAQHNATLHAKTKHLNAKRYAALHFTGPGTDLKVGLSDGHLWLGGSEPSKNGIVCNPNIPSEEVFTTPHKDRVDGYVRSTKPLSYQGTLIRDIEVRFEAGRIVQATASAGQNVLEKVLSTDEGASRLGEVALGHPLLPHLRQRPAILQHPVRRKRRQPRRHRPSLPHLPGRRHHRQRRRTRQPRGKQQPDPYRLDDRLRPDRRRRRAAGWRQRAGHAPGGMGVERPRPPLRSHSNGPKRPVGTLAHSALGTRQRTVVL